MTLHLAAVAILALALVLSFAVAIIAFQVKSLCRLRRIEGLIRHIPNRDGYDIFKVADELRETAQTLCDHAPHIMRDHPWVEAHLLEAREYLFALAYAAGVQHRACHSSLPWPSAPAVEPPRQPADAA